jgi:hypothetical protein
MGTDASPRIGVNTGVSATLEASAKLALSEITGSPDAVWAAATGTEKTNRRSEAVAALRSRKPGTQFPRIGNRPAA